MKKDYTNRKTESILALLEQYVPCKWEYTGSPLRLFRCSHDIEISREFIIDTIAEQSMHVFLDAFVATHKYTKHQKKM